MVVTGRRTLAAALTMSVAAVVFVVATVGDGPGAPAPPAVEPVAPPVAAADAPPTPEHPSGRFLPTWLPGSLRVSAEQEWAAADRPEAAGWTRTYSRRGPLAGDQDVVTISLQKDAPALDVDAEVARYAGARRTTVQGRPAVFLGLVAARHDAALVWSPVPGRLAQVLGSGVSDDELAGVAEGLLPPPHLDATPLPQGFTEIQRSDGRAYRSAVPRRYAVNTLPLRGPARPEGTPSVQVISAWGGTVPEATTTVAVRDRTGVVTGAGTETVLTWSERPNLVVSVTGTNVELDDVRRIALGLREQSVEEVEARPTGAQVLLAHGELGGTRYELRTRGGGSGRCLELAHGMVSSACSGDPMQDVVDFRASISEGMAFGSVLLDAAGVRLELDGGLTVETEAVGKAAGAGTAFYVVAVPPEATSVRAVVALGPAGEEIRRTPVP